jgi:hypothetical protein
MTDELDELICKHLEIIDGGRAIGFSPHLRVEVFLVGQEMRDDQRCSRSWIGRSECMDDLVPEAAYLLLLDVFHRHEMLRSKNDWRLGRPIST